MKTVGIRELRQQASELLRQVREQGNPVQITYHGKVVALLVPAESAGEQENEAVAWAELDELAAQIGNAWTGGVSASQAIADQRR